MTPVSHLEYISKQKDDNKISAIMELLFTCTCVVESGEKIDSKTYASKIYCKVDCEKVREYAVQITWRRKITNGGNSEHKGSEMEIRARDQGSRVI